MASARFRAKAKERQLELDRLKHQVAQLRREKADLEAECRATRENLEREAERQRASTMAWIMDHFWLRRKVHFKTLANSVRWMVRGNYRPGMTEAALARAEARARGEYNRWMTTTKGSASPTTKPTTEESRTRPGTTVTAPRWNPRSGRRGSGTTDQSVFAQRVAAFGERITGSFRGLARTASWPKSPTPRPHTR